MDALSTQIVAQKARIRELELLMRQTLARTSKLLLECAEVLESGDAPKGGRSWKLARRARRNAAALSAKETTGKRPPAKSLGALH